MKSVLIAEPHRPTLELLRQTLSEAGYRVLATDQAAEALEQCVSERPDAVVMAVDLAALRGTSLGKLIRATDVGRRLPVLAVDKAHLGRALGVGAVLDQRVDAYLPDATRREELLARVAQLIASAAQAPKPTSGIAATLSRPPVATGDLKARGLPGYLHSWYRLARDGVLVVVHSELTRHIYFLGGAPVNFDSTARGDSLPAWMHARGALSSEQYEEGLGLMRDDRLSAGAALVAIGAVEPGEPLLTVLRDWARWKIGETLGMAQGRFSFYAGNEFTNEVPTLELPALGPMYEAVRRTWPAKAFASALASRLNAYPARTADFARDLPALGLTTADLKIALEITGGRMLRELLGASKDLKHALALFWYLTTVGSLKYSPTPAESVDAPGFELAVKAAARRRKPLPEDKAAALRDEAVRVLTASYFRLLNLDISADGEQVERAYHEVAMRFHPDAYPEYDVGPIEDLMASVQDRLSAAYRVLSDEVRRKAYVGYLLSRAEVPRSAALNVDAEVELKRGENLMKGGDWRGALRAFEKAVSLNPREPEYYCYLAWATFNAGDGAADARARAASRLLKKALSLNPTLERAQVIAAIIEDELGDPAEARRLLLRVLKANPASELARKALQGLSRRHGG